MVKEKFVAKLIKIGDVKFESSKNIMLCGDEKYIKYVGITLTSIMLSNPGEQIAFHIICDGMSDDDLQRMYSVNKTYGCHISIYYLNTALILKLSASVNKESHVNVAGLFRIIGFSVLPVEVKKILYLDSDILVDGKIGDFWSHNMNEAVVIAVEDLESDMHKREIGVAGYFNSGVMFVDLLKWNALDLTKKSLETTFNGEKYRFVDQDVLNIVLENKTTLFPSKFNFMYRLNYTAVDEILIGEVPVIWHFIGISKPWHEWTQGFEIVNKYNNVVRNSFWSDNQIVTVKNITDKKTQYKVYKIIARGHKKRKEYVGFFFNALRYGILKLKYKILD